MSNSVTPWTAAPQASLSFTISRICSNSCPLSQRCHPTISSSVTPFSSCPQSFPASGSFPGAFLVAQTVKNPPERQETQVRSLGQEDPLEKGMGTHSSILAWRIPWSEKPGRLWSMGTEELGTLLSMRLQKVRHDCVTNTFVCLQGSNSVITYVVG